MYDIKDEFNIMRDIVRTNEETTCMFRNNGEEDITGFCLPNYELISTYEMEPIYHRTSRKKGTRKNTKLDMRYYYINTALDLSHNTFKYSVAKRII